MDHVWNSLRQWETVWKERIEYEEKKDWGEYAQYKDEEIKELKEQLEAIRKAMKIVGKWN